MKLLQKIMIALTFVALATNVGAAEKGTQADAVALVKKAVAYLKKNDKEKALAEFSNPKGQFIDRDMYIFVIDQNGTMLAHGSLPKIIGKAVLEMKDADNKFLFKEMLAVTSKSSSGWVHYKWPNPISKAVEAKSTYLEKVDDLVIGCGIYQ